ncbi:MAG: MBL fold metallo-hydrolase [Actinomycetota bacterium]
MPPILRYPDGVIAIDCEMAGHRGLIAAFVIEGPNPAIIETGPATVMPDLVSGLNELGIGPDDVATFVGTHIHLDHAGAAGDVIASFPSATIAVHEQGVRHMVDPSKLMASAYRVFGPALDTVFGPLKPVPSDKLRSLVEGDTIDVGPGRKLDVLYTPGHARHHITLHDSQTGALFAGDSMGVYLPESGILRPAAPPPDFDLELALHALERYRELDPQTIYFSHFGPAPAGRDMIAEARAKLLQFGRIVREAMKQSHDIMHVAEALQEATREEYAEVYKNPELLAKFEALNAFPSSAAGYIRYFEQNPEAELPAH